jgi:hypothetical protein
MRFKRYPGKEPLPVTPRKRAAAQRAVQKEKDRYPLFPELVRHHTADERLEAIGVHRDKWWRGMRDHQARQWRRARALLRSLPETVRVEVRTLWQKPIYPGDPVYFLELIRRYEKNREEQRRLVEPGS